MKIKCRDGVEEGDLFVTVTMSATSQGSYTGTGSNCR